MIFILHRKAIENLLLLSNIKERNYCLDKVTQEYFQNEQTVDFDLFGIGFESVTCFGQTG